MCLPGVHERSDLPAVRVQLLRRRFWDDVDRRRADAATPID
jgi:hypothetical protein